MGAGSPPSAAGAGAVEATGPAGEAPEAGAGRFQPVSEERLTQTLAELFLRGVAPEEVSSG